MQWFFAPAIRLFFGTRVAANLYWIGVLALFLLLILIALISVGEASWIMPGLRTWRW